MPSRRVQNWKKLAQQLLREVERDHVSNGAAALAFYMVLALFPAAIFGLSLLPYLGIPHLHEATMDLVRQALPGPSADMLTSTAESVVSQRNGRLLSFGFAFAIWSASSGLYAVMQQLNVVYDVAENRSYWRTRGVTVGERTRAPANIGPATSTSTTNTLERRTEPAASVARRAMPTTPHRALRYNDPGLGRDEPSQARHLETHPCPCSPSIT